MAPGKLALLAAVIVLGAGCNVEVTDPAPYDVAPPPPGGVALSWNLIADGYRASCDQAGVTTVHINLEDSAGNLVLGPDGVTESCADFAGNTSAVVFDQLAPGAYQVLMDASGYFGGFYEQAPYWVSVDPGTVANPNSPEVVPLYQ